MVAARRQYGICDSASTSSSSREGSDSGTYKPPPGAMPLSTTSVNVGLDESSPRVSRYAPPVLMLGMVAERIHPSRLRSVAASECWYAVA